MITDVVEKVSPLQAKDELRILHKFLDLSCQEVEEDNLILKRMSYPIFDEKVSKPDMTNVNMRSVSIVPKINDHRMNLLGEIF